MKKYISLMNSYTFYYLWNSKFKFHIETMIKEIIKKEEKYILKETFNSISNHLKSYIFLESKNSLIYIEFNINENVLAIYNYLKISTNKDVILIIFNSIKGINKNKNNIYYIYQNETNNTFLKLFLCKNFKEQTKSELKEIIDYLYNLDNDFYLSYLREEKLNSFKNYL